jgi:lipopolysaccharide biosynthesis glycosyltransferase
MYTGSFGTQTEVKIAPDRESVVVVCAADNNYAMPLAVTMRSTIDNLQDNCNIFFYVIDGGITAVNQRKILKSLPSERCKVEFIQIPNSVVEKITAAHQSTSAHLSASRPDYISIASFYRLLLPELLPNQIEKVIYLDCDLAVEGNLSELWQADMGENYLLAVRDTWTPCISSPTGRLNYQKLGLDPNAPYFNAGVLVIDLKKWRDNHFSEKVLKYFTQNLEFIGLYDQGLLNVLLVGKWGKLDPKWNFNVTSFYDYSSNSYLAWTDSQSFYSEDIYNRLVSNPSIVHFISDKPWVSRHCPSSANFFKYVDKTKWSGWRITIWRRLWRKLVPSRSRSVDWI